jgi:hypothetical protein
MRQPRHVPWRPDQNAGLSTQYERPSSSGLRGNGEVEGPLGLLAYQTSRRQRKKVEMLFAHLKRILKLDRLRLRGPNGARDEFHLAATAQNLRKLAKLIPRPSPILAT